MTWSQPKLSGPQPLPRSLHSACLIGTKMYIYGGWVPIKNESGDSKDSSASTENDRRNMIQPMLHEKEWKCSNSLGILDLETWTWIHNSPETTNDSTPKGRAGHCAVPISTRMYIWSGRDGYKKAANKNQVCYNDLWYLETEPPTTPTKPALIRANTNTLEIYWGQLTNADYYIVQTLIYEEPSTNQSNSQHASESQVSKVKDETNDESQPALKKTKLAPRLESNVWYYSGTFSTNMGLVTNVWIPKENTQLIDERMIDTNNPPKFQEKGYERIDLESGSSYKMRICGVNACGLGPWSEVAALKTCVPGFPAAPAAIKIIKDGAGGASITWEVPQGSHDILEYWVYLAVKKSPQSTSINANNHATAFIKVYAGKENSCIVPSSQLSQALICTKQKPSIIFRLAAKNSKGLGPATQVRWLQDAVPPTPTPTTSPNTTPTSSQTPSTPTSAPNPVPASTLASTPTGTSTTVAEPGPDPDVKVEPATPTAPAAAPPAGPTSTPTSATPATGTDNPKPAAVDLLDIRQNVQI